ncbi:hypothetical protein NW813_05510 [Synechococcus sp. R55.6]|uniref:hypothetical protein n=1 Tax=unclassified Synechococcus TaxID=2626047 RepID=UPI0039C2E3AD
MTMTPALRIANASKKEGELCEDYEKANREKSPAFGCGENVKPPPLQFVMATKGDP